MLYIYMAKVRLPHAIHILAVWPLIGTAFSPLKAEDHPYHSSCATVATQRNIPDEMLKPWESEAESLSLSLLQTQEAKHQVLSEGVSPSQSKVTPHTKIVVQQQSEQQGRQIAELQSAKEELEVELKRAKEALGKAQGVVQAKTRRAPHNVLLEQADDVLNDPGPGNAHAGASEVAIFSSIHVVAPWKLCGVLAMFIVQAVAISRMGLDSGAQLLISIVRCAAQLMILGYIIAPAFAANNPWFVLAYVVVFMVLIASWEAAARPRLMYPRMLQNTIISVSLGLLTTLAMLYFVVEPTPWYDARYVIPLAGVAVLNVVTGVATSLNMLTELLEAKKERVEILLSLGATPYEAAWPDFAQTMRQALIVWLNCLATAGLVSIPGTMAGALLAGADPHIASVYQIVVLAVSCIGNTVSVTCVCLLTIQSLFDMHDRLQPDLLTKQERSSINSLVTWIIDPRNWCKSSEDSNPCEKTVIKEPLCIHPAGAFPSLRLQAKKSYSGNSPCIALDLDVKGLVASSNPLQACMPVHVKEIACIMGPSGIGKSTLLRMVSDLQPAGVGTLMKLHGKEREKLSPQAWRRDVMYVHQSRTPLPGTPADLVKDVQKFKVNQGCSLSRPVDIMEKLGLPEEMLGRQWSKLSAGESQRMMFAIALCLKPACLLLDEPTSALDEENKISFEKMIQACECCAVVVTHDKQQASRIGDSIWQLDVDDDPIEKGSTPPTSS